MEGKKLVTIIGNIGAGKTTSLPLVARALDADIIRADELFQTNPFRDNFLQDISRWGFTNELYLIHKRISLIKKALEESTKQTVVVDSGLLMSWVYTKSHYLSGKITLDEWLFFDELFTKWSSFALHTTLIYLSASQTTLLKRITKRKRDYEIRLYKKEYLEQIEVGLRDLCANFAENVEKIISIDTTHLNLLNSHTDKMHFMELVKQKV